MTHRIIRFRAWDIGKSEMIYDGIEYALRCLKLSEEGGSTCIGFSPSETLNFKIMQFTGLYDKYGVEIYEGDIMSYECEWDKEENHTVGVVEFSSKNYAGLPSFNINNSDSDIYGQNPVDYLGEKLKVIGNIYEHSGFLDDSN